MRLMQTKRNDVDAEHGSKDYPSILTRSATQKKQVNKTDKSELNPLIASANKATQTRAIRGTSTINKSVVPRGTTSQSFFFEGEHIT